MNLLRLCVFPTDPVQAYVAKGEIKERYWNPCNFFDEIWVLSPSEDTPNSDCFRLMAGKAVLHLLAIGGYRKSTLMFDQSRVLSLVRSIRPDIIRAYDPLMAGWLATHCAKSVNVPSVVSVHSDFDRDIRYRLLIEGRVRELLAYVASRITLEPYSLKNASRVIAVSHFCADYATRLGANDVSVVYNRVDGTKFSPELRTSTSTEVSLRILSVGNLIRGKGHDILIRAIADLGYSKRDAELTIVGQGPEFKCLRKLARKFAVEDRVIFVPGSLTPQCQRFMRITMFLLQLLVMAAFQFRCLKQWLQGFQW